MSLRFSYTALPALATASCRSDDRMQFSSGTTPQFTFHSAGVIPRRANARTRFLPFASVASLIQASGRHHDIKHTDWATDDKTGVEHPCEVCDLPDGRCAQLLGCGHRPKKVAGLLGIDVYSVGLYANVESLKSALSHHKGKPASALGSDQSFLKDFSSPLVEKELRFVIVFRSVTRAAFWSNFSSRLGPIVKGPVGVAFEDHFKNVDFRKGTEIRLAMCRNGSLRTIVNQVEQGALTSPELCAAITDIYVGDDPPSAAAKHDVLNTVADILNNSQYNPPMGSNHH